MISLAGMEARVERFAAEHPDVVLRVKLSDYSSRFDFQGTMECLGDTYQCRASIDRVELLRNGDDYVTAILRQVVQRTRDAAEQRELEDDDLVWKLLLDEVRRQPPVEAASLDVGSEWIAPQVEPSFHTLHASNTTTRLELSFHTLYAPGYLNKAVIPIWPDALAQARRSKRALQVYAKQLVHAGLSAI